MGSVRLYSSLPSLHNDLANAFARQMILALQLCHSCAVAVMLENLFVALRQQLPSSADFAPACALVGWFGYIDQIALDIFLQLRQETRGKHVSSIFVVQDKGPPRICSILWLASFGLSILHFALFAASLSSVVVGVVPVLLMKRHLPL